MTALNRLHGGKNIKLPYFIAQLSRYAVPKVLLRSRLEEILRDGEKRYDMDYVLDRVNYYNRLTGAERLSPTEATPLKEHKFRGRHSAYIFDSYQTTRFSTIPCVGRPISATEFSTCFIRRSSRLEKSTGGGEAASGKGDNSVLLNLDRCRLDIRLHDKIPFTEKADRVIFRGSVKSSEQRRRFIETFRDNPRIDTADTRSGHSAQETGTAKQITLYAHLDSKFIMTFEGNDIASNIRWVMSTNSIAVMPRPRNESWFMEGRLRPGYHYIEVRDDYSDLEEKIDYYIAHPEQAQQIIDHANDFARQFYDSRRERFISLLVMKKYFEKQDSFLRRTDDHDTAYRAAGRRDRRPVAPRPRIHPAPPQLAARTLRAGHRRCQKRHPPLHRGQDTPAGRPHPAGTGTRLAQAPGTRPGRKCLSDRKSVRRRGAIRPDRSRNRPRRHTGGALYRRRHRTPLVIWQF